MPLADAEFWSDRLRKTLECYDEALLRSVAAKLFKPRGQWPAEELIERSLATIGNAVALDRRLQELEPVERRAMALIAHSRQPRWSLGNLIEMLMALGHSDGVAPILRLLEAGLLYPSLHPSFGKLRSFEQWIGQAGTVGLLVFAHPQVSIRALGEDLGLPILGEGTAPAPALTALNQPSESDGLEWPLRMSIVWQIVSGGPLRRTQQGEFFKRDLERLSQDALLASPPSDNLTDIPDRSMLAVALAEAEGLIAESEGELRAMALPATWDDGLMPTVASLFAALPLIDSWSPTAGWQGVAPLGRANPYASANLLALLLLARLPANGWARPSDVADWLREHHPYWTAESLRPSQQQTGAEVFLLGIAYALKLLQVVRDAEGTWLVRLSSLGRWLLGFGEAPPAPPAFPQTLLVQPNLEIIAYRHGLNPSLIGNLSRFAAWKSLGAACLLQLQPESVYRALESGLTFQTILRLLERHGTRQVPMAVVDALRTWADKRERISVYPSATLFEFATAEDLTTAIARGLPGTRITDTLAVVPSEAAVDFRQFRLTGNRDYGLPPEKCVEVDADGVLLSIDLSRSDLLVETEVRRFTEPVGQAVRDGRKQFRITPESLAAGREGGFGLKALEDWFQQRVGQPVSPAARLLLTAASLPAAALSRPLVLNVSSPEVADGLEQWPGTRSLIEERLGPTTLVVSEANTEELRKRLQALGLNLKG